MKTSSKLILIAVLLVVVSLGYYDYRIKQVFDSGKYNDPYNTFTTLAYKNFDAVDVISSTAANVKFEQGPFSIKIDSIALEYVKITQSGTHLQISAVFKDGYLYNRNMYLIVIRCPRLSVVNINARYYINNGKPYIDTIVHENWNMKQVLIDGFKQDTLSVDQDYGSTLVFDHNAIKTIRVTTGRSQASQSKTIVLEDNQFNNAAFNIGNKSKLIINTAKITALNLRLADSARMEINGAAQQILNNVKPIENEINH